MVFQICFDVYESTTQHFVDSVSYPDYPFHIELRGLVYIGHFWVYLLKLLRVRFCTILYVI